MKVLLIDNYDSFTYNIAQYLKELNANVHVIKNDEFADAKELLNFDYTHLIISPGPNSPKESKLSLEALEFLKYKKKILGICLGHQCIAYYFGGKIDKLKNPKHGKLTRIHFKKHPLFDGCKQGFKVCLYHSLYISKMPQVCEVLARSDEGVIMALAHKSLPIYGVQFHPEAILSEYGKELLHNFLNL